MKKAIRRLIRGKDGKLKVVFIDLQTLQTIPPNQVHQYQIVNSGSSFIEEEQEPEDTENAIDIANEEETQEVMGQTAREGPVTGQGMFSGISSPAAAGVQGFPAAPTAPSTPFGTATPGPFSPTATFGTPSPTTSVAAPTTTGPTGPVGPAPATATPGPFSPTSTFGMAPVGVQQQAAQTAGVAQSPAAAPMSPGNPGASLAGFGATSPTSQISAGPFSPTSPGMTATGTFGGTTGTTATEAAAPGISGPTSTATMGTLGGPSTVSGVGPGVSTVDTSTVSPATGFSSPQEAYAGHIASTAMSMGMNETQAGLAAAQASVETGFGEHSVGNNHFGIKSETGPTVAATTQEHGPQGFYSTVESFAAFADPSESVEAYGQMMSENFSQAFTAESIADAIAGLDDGTYGSYATDPGYQGKVAAVYSNVVAPALTAVKGIQAMQTGLGLMGLSPQQNPGTFSPGYTGTPGFTGFGPGSAGVSATGQVGGSAMSPGPAGAFSDMGSPSATAGPVGQTGGVGFGTHGFGPGGFGVGPGGVGMGTGTSSGPAGTGVGATGTSAGAGVGPSGVGAGTGVGSAGMGGGMAGGFGMGGPSDSGAAAGQSSASESASGGF